MKVRWSAASAIASPALGFATLVALVFALTNLLMLGAAEAQGVAGTSTATTAAVAPGSSPVLAMMQGLVGLVVVIGLIFAAGWLMKKIGPRAQSGGLVQVLGGASVGAREKVVVVRFGTQTLLLGVAPGQVTLLHAAEPGEHVAPDASSAAAAPRFVDRLRAARGTA